MQQYAGLYLMQNHSTLHVSGVHSHPSSGVNKTVTAASGTGHSNSFSPWPLATEDSCCYDLYQRLQLQFYVLLMTGAMDTRNM